MTSDDTNRTGDGAPKSRRRRRRRGGRKRSGGGSGESKPGSSSGRSGGPQGDGQPGGGKPAEGAPGTGRKRRRRRRGKKSGRGRGAEGAEQARTDGGAAGASGERTPQGERGEGRRRGGRGRRRSGRDRQRGRGRDPDREPRRASELAESRPEAIPEAAEREATGSGSVPEMTPEGLARWEPPPYEPDPDGEDVLPAPASADVAPSGDGDETSAEETSDGDGETAVEPATVADDEPDEPLPRGEVYNLAYVRVQTSTRLQDFDAGELSLQRGDMVVVQGDRGQAIGAVVAPTTRRLVTDKSSRRILRRATEHDLIQRDRNEDKGRGAMPYARERIVARKLPMKLTRVEYLHGGSKAVFYFSAEGRVDFRELVKDLAQRLRTRIEMRQIGVRDEAKMVGGIGVCGLRLCCHRYLTKFEPVSIRMAKDQNLVLNPQKVSGQCGRLKCCLAYEQEIYREQRKGMPKLGKFVETPDGVGKVVELDILARRVRVNLGQGKSEVFSAEDVSPAPPPGRR